MTSSSFGFGRVGQDGGTANGTVTGSQVPPRRRWRRIDPARIGGRGCEEVAGETGPDASGNLSMTIGPEERTVMADREEAGARKRGGKRGRGLRAAAALGIVLSLLQGISHASAYAFSDGFETGNLAGWSRSSGMAVQQQLVHEGSWAARATSTGQPAYAYKLLESTYQDLYYRIYFDLVSNSTTVTLLRIRTSTGVVILTVGVNKSVKLFTNVPTAAKNTVGDTVTRGAGVWHELQVHVLVSANSSREDVWLDGAAVPTLSRSDPLGTTPAGRIDLGDAVKTRTFDVAFDEVVADPSLIDTRAPSTPTGLAMLSFSDRQVDLSWNASSDNLNVTGYTIYRSDDGGATYKPIDTSSTTSYSDTTVSAATTYSYSVDAFDGSGNHSGTSAPVTVGTLSGPPSSPVSVWVGYYDTHHPSHLQPKPSPWMGSPSTVFVGTPDSSSGGWDSSGIRVDNLTGAPLSRVVVKVDIGSHHFALWGGNSIPAGYSLVLAQTAFENFDGSDYNPAGCDECNPDLCNTQVLSTVPVVHVTVNGVTTNYSDTGQILNTHGVDSAGCPDTGGTRNDESEVWHQIG